MSKSKKPDLNIVTLGCPKNLVDSEILHGALSGSFNVSHNGNGKSYHTVIINTCGFILDAKKESIDVILHYVNEKERGRVKKLLVFGCLSQRYPVELAREIPEVDKFYGAGCYREITEDLTCGGINEISPVRIISTPMHYAYLKIAEGCNRRCSFCAIPSIRGRYRSFDTDLLIKEAKYLEEIGVKELILIAQDLTYYGYDKNKKQALTSLIEKLADVKGIEWIRLHYAYPNTFPDSLITLIHDHPKICRYVDIPLQHISDKILASMRRGIRNREIKLLLDKLRKEIPGLAIRTTMMTGFPGETEKDYLMLRNFIEEQRFERLGVFEYSHEEGTHAGRTLKNNVTAAIKAERASDLMLLQQQISLENNLKMKGKTIKVIIDRVDNDRYIGRTEFDSPEIDNEVHISKKKTVKPGDFCQVVINNATEYDLHADMIIASS